MGSCIYIVWANAYLEWARLAWKSPWIIHGALTHGSHGNEETWVLGFTWM